jgi:hypothetical protein
VGLPDPLEKFIDPNALHDRNEVFFAWSATTPTK